LAEKIFHRDSSMGAGATSSAQVVLIGRVLRSP
jgi:hypothetical protein